MTKAAFNSDLVKSKGQVIFEHILLVICLCVIALRTTFAESPTVQSTTLPGNLNDNVYSLAVSAVLIFAFVFWLVRGLCSKRFLYRPTGIEIGLCLFCVAAIAAGLTAANKRAAISNFVTLLAPIFMAVLLVQILDSPSKIKLLLICIAALGVVSAYECAYQFFVTNQVTIEQYEQAPQTILEPLGIEPGTLQHFLFEHRLYSRGVRGFFTTRNSAGSFMLMAFFAAITLFIEKLKYRRHYWFWSLWLVTSGIAVVVVLCGLAITRSKGAIVGVLFAVALLIALFSFGNWIRAHKKAILLVCLLLAVAVGSVVILYGLNHDRLPGGSSMLVRWQYWHASAKMYADHPLKGVGPGNFAHYYTHYKPAEALETVADPHNFLLSILTQYGPLGLIGFLAMIFVPLWKSIAPTPSKVSQKPQHYLLSFIIPAAVYLIAVSVVLRTVRPMISPLSLVGTPEEKKDALILLYVIPVRVFIVGFFLLAASWKLGKTPATNIPSAALFCAVLGVALHNLIDFALFEPGIFTTLWAIIACVIILGFRTKSRQQLVLKPAPFVKVITAAAALVLVWAYFNYAFIPVAKSTAGIQRAHQAISAGQFQQAHNLLNTAAKNDSLSPTALSLNGRLYLHHFELTQSKNRDLLAGAEVSLLKAISRDNAAFKNFEKLTTVYDNFAKLTPNEKGDWLEKAYNSAKEAVKRYPGSGRLRIKLAKIAEQLGKTDIAIKHYEEAINIEDKYRCQFREMYPTRALFSRLGEEKYQFAKDRLKFLFEQKSP
jgi:O-antigen ligase